MNFTDAQCKRLARLYRKAAKHFATAAGEDEFVCHWLSGHSSDPEARLWFIELFRVPGCGSFRTMSVSPGGYMWLDTALPPNKQFHPLRVLALLLAAEIISHP